MESVLYKIFLFIFGSSVGSFLNVYRFRYSKPISIIYPRSFCPKCQKQIPWYLNIPIISWFILMGKCKFCKSKISFSYPLIEFVTASLFTINSFSLNLFAPNHFVELFGLTFFTALIIAISLIDFDNYIIPNNLLVFGIISGILFNFFTRSIYFGDRFLTIIYEYLLLSLLLFICFEFFNFIISTIIRKDAFGFGDSKYLFMISIWLGLNGAISTLILSLYIGGVISIFLILFKKIPRKGKIPFGPYLSISAYIVAIIGSDTIFLFLKNLYNIR